MSPFFSEVQKSIKPLSVVPNFLANLSKLSHVETIPGCNCLSALATSSDIFTCCFPNEKPFFASYCASCMQNDLLCITLWYNLFEKEVENYEIY